MATNLRDKLRAATVGARKDWREETVEFGGETFVIREPSERQRAMIFDRARTEVDDERTEQRDGVNVNVAEFSVWALICCVRTTEGENVFEPADYDSLIEMPASQLDPLKKAAVSLVNVDREAVTKN